MTMQFYLNGYRTGDPFVEDPHPSVAQRPGGLPGLVLAAKMATSPDTRTAVVDRRDGPLEVGQADGVACRTVEMFEAFGLADRLVREAYWVNEVSFWRPDPDDPGQVRRRLRRCAQRDPDRDRPRAGRRRDGRGLGRDGRAGRHRLPGHPPEVGDLHHEGQHPDHPARGWLPRAVLRRARL